MTDARLDSFGTDGADSDDTSQKEADARSTVDRILNRISPETGLAFTPVRAGTRYLFRDDHDRWYILQPSAKQSVDAYIK
jgi:hypothetical protein